MPDVSKPQVVEKNIQVYRMFRFYFQINMENVSLSIKEEIADETKYGSSNLHHDIGVLVEDSSKVNVRQKIRFFFLLQVLTF